MKKILILVLICVLLIGTIFINGCGKTTTTTSRDDNFLSTKHSTTTCKGSNCQTASNSCPFWNRDC
ncbi:MAG: hypothetical protein KJ674_01445 [Nanoarchaeota archaeon]|nr:hypothetical protein [Nanoarchaeota archaeon]